jgi:hypothetical protein
MPSTSEKRFPFSIILSFSNSQKSAADKTGQESTADNPWRKCLFLLTRSEKYAGEVSW